MKLLHRPAHTVSPSLHRETLSRASRWKLVMLGALIGGLLTGSGTFAFERIHRELAGHHDAIVQQRLQHHAAHTSLPTIAGARRRRIAQVLPPWARAACFAAITTTRFTSNVIEQRAACVRALRVTR